MSNAARQKERDIRGTEAKAAEQAALDRGERVDVPGKIYQSYEDADRAARDMNDEGDGYFYEPKVFLNDDSHARYVMTKRKKEVVRERDERRAARNAESKTASQKTKDAAPSPSAIESKPEQGGATRITPEAAGDMKAGDIIKTSNGDEYVAMRARHDFIDAHHPAEKQRHILTKRAINTLRNG